MVLLLTNLRKAVMAYPQVDTVISAVSVLIVLEEGLLVRISSHIAVFCVSFIQTSEMSQTVNYNNFDLDK